VNKKKIHSIYLDVISKQEVLDKVVGWIDSRKEENCGHSIYLANVHMCMEAMDDESYKKIINSADLALMDGKPLSIFLKLLGHKDSIQIRGEDLTNELCRLSSKNKYRVGFYGSTQETLKTLNTKILNQFPELDICFLESPPFRKLTSFEKKYYIDKINNNSVDILFVGLGCPKQEIWINDNIDKINSVMLGVGAAFDFISGNKKQAPKWMVHFGLEWFFRLISEPKRLWKRYLKHNPRFLIYSVFELIRRKRV